MQRHKQICLTENLERHLFIINILNALHSTAYALLTIYAVIIKIEKPVSILWCIKELKILQKLWC